VDNLFTSLIKFTSILNLWNQSVEKKVQRKKKLQLSQKKISSIILTRITFGALRLSEAVNITYDNIKESEEGLWVTVHRKKTDRSGIGNEDHCGENMFLI